MLAGQKVVETEPSLVVQLTPQRVCGQHQLQPVGKKRRLFQPVTTLQQCFSDELQLGQVEGLERQFQVADSAMEKLGAAAAGATADVAGIQQRHRESPPHGLHGHGSTAGTGTDHQQVNVVISHASPGCGSRRHSSGHVDACAARC